MKKGVKKVLGKLKKSGDKVLTNKEKFEAHTLEDEDEIK